MVITELDSQNRRIEEDPNPTTMAISSSSPSRPNNSQYRILAEPHQLESNLPTTIASNGVKSRKLTLIPLIFLIYFEVSGGPFGEEPSVKAAGPLFAILGFLIFPFIWSIPEALITAELATAFPGNGGYVIWADQAFGPFWGFFMGSSKFLSGVINNAAYPVLCVNYLKLVFPIFTSVVSLCPFVLMALISIPKLHPRRWISLGQKEVKKDWNLYLNTLFWNLNFWDNASTLAGEVNKPQTTFPKALFSAGILTCFGYIIPLLAATGSLELNQNKWENGYLADAAGMIAGNWLKFWVELGSVLSGIGLFEAQLSSCAFQLLGMADLGFLPRIFALRSSWFDTPWVGILLSSLITLAVSYMDFTDIISSANFLYSMGMLLEFAAFIWLRRKYPTLTRPYKVPLGIPGLICMCLVPTGFLIFVMAVATKMVYVVSASLTLLGVAMYFLMRFCKSRTCLEFIKKEEDEKQADGN